MQMFVTHAEFLLLKTPIEYHAACFATLLS